MTSNHAHPVFTDAVALAARFDHHDPLSMQDPVETYRRLRAECPIGRSELHDSFWVVSRYEDVLTVASDPDQYCSGQGIAIPGTSSEMRVEPQESDGERHAQIRKQMNSWFSRGQVQAMRPAIEALSASLLADRIGEGAFDLAIDYALPLASLTMLRILGMPEEFEAPLRRNIDVILHARTANENEVTEAGAELYQCISEILAERGDRAENGVDGGDEDLIDKIMATEIDGVATSEFEQVLMILSLVLAGLETSALAIASTAGLLIEQPELRERLIAEPALIPSAIDEFLRYTSPVVAIGRHVTAETTLGGQSLKPEDQLLLLYGSANRDPEAFPDPDDVVLDRHPNRHVSFGFGIHRCVGQHVARLELEIALRHMLTMLPPFTITPGALVEWSFGENRGIRSLPVTLAP